MPTTCTRCSKSHSGPAAFLLTCSKCSKPWHHRCHIPPVSDAELITRIKASNSGDIPNGVSGWACRRCVKNTEPRSQVSQPKLPVSASAPKSLSMRRREEEKPAPLTAQVSGQNINIGATLLPEQTAPHPAQVPGTTDKLPPYKETSMRPAPVSGPIPRLHEKDKLAAVTPTPPYISQASRQDRGAISPPETPASYHGYVHGLVDTRIPSDKTPPRLGRPSTPLRPGPASSSVSEVTILPDNDESRSRPKHPLSSQNPIDSGARPVPHPQQGTTKVIPPPDAEGLAPHPQQHLARKGHATPPVEDSGITTQLRITAIPSPGCGESSRPTGVHSSLDFQATLRSASTLTRPTFDADHPQPPQKSNSNHDATVQAHSPLNARGMSTTADDDDDDDPLEYVDIPPALLQKYTSRKAVRVISQTPLLSPAPISAPQSETQSSAVGPSWLYQRLLELNINSLPDASMGAKRSTSVRSRKTVARRLKDDPLMRENLFQFSARSWLRENRSQMNR